MRRRLALAMILAVAGLAGCASKPTGAAAAYPTVGAIEIYDPRARAIIPEEARIEKLTEDAFGWSEGPVWIRDRGYLLFTDVPGNAIHKWSEKGGLELFMKPAGYEGPPSDLFREPGANGLIRFDDDSILMADHGNRMVARLDLATKAKTPIATSYDGARFNSPNDLALASSGAIYFTDPPYGLEGLDASPAKEARFNGVYRISPLSASGERTVSVLDKSLSKPNGIILSPDETLLYVAVSDPEAAKIYRYRLGADGMPTAREVFADLTSKVGPAAPGLPDGMAMDQEGNLYATGPGGVRVFAPDGTMLALISTGAAAANVTFGDADGRTLYITSGAFLARVRISARGVGF